jgi:hypothetical protein
VDQNGNVLYTDDISNVPPDQREKVQQYIEIKTAPEAVASPEDAQESIAGGQEAELEEQGTTATLEETAEDQAAAEVQSGSTTTASRQVSATELLRDRLQDEEAAIAQEYEALGAEIAALEEQRAAAKTKAQVDAYNKNAEALNERVAAFKKRRQAFNKEVNAYNELVISQDEQEESQPAEQQQ